MGAFLAALARLLGLYNGGNYSATTNPGGLGNDGHRVNFVPALQDVATVGQGVADLATQVTADRDAAGASATAAGASQTAAAGSATSAGNSASASDASRIAAGNSQVAAAGSAAAAAASETAAGNSATAAAGSATAAAGSASTASSAVTAAQTHATNSSNSATAAGNSAAAALVSETNAAASAAKLIGTSGTNSTIGTGSKSFTTQSGKFFAPGTDIQVTSDANPATNRMLGVVTAYSGTSLTVEVSQAFGTGSYSDWTIRVAGAPGRIGTNGWTSIEAIVNDGERRVKQVIDWTGGTGTKPATGQYISATGFTSDISLAANVRGPAGSGSGDVNTTGAVSDGNIAVFDGPTGDLIRDGGQMPTLSSLNGQPLDATLTAFAALAIAANKLAYGTGADTFDLTDFTAFARSLLDDPDAATARATLGLVIGTNVQAYDAELTALAALTSAANKLPYFTGSGTAGLADLSAFARTLLDDADAAAMRATLGLGTAATSAAAAFAAAIHGHNVADLQDASANARAFLQAANYAAMRTALGVVPGTDVQAFSAELAALAGQSSTAFGRQFLTRADAAAARTLLALATVAATGSYNDLTDKPTIPAALTKGTSAQLRAGTNDTDYHTAASIQGAFAFVGLTDASTIAIDMATGFNFSVTLGGNRTLGAPTNALAGKSGLILIAQDGTGSRTLSFNAAWKFAGGTPTASTAAGTVDAIAYTVTTGGASPIIRATYIKAFA